MLVQENKTGDAIAVLEKLVAVEPKRARELYQRMAQYALQLYRDDDAIKYAARAVELNPDDAEGHRRLGEMYRQRQDVEHAIVEYRAAIAKNDRLYITYLELADLLLSKGQGDEADRLFRRVIRGAPDEELVSRAARLSMQINLGKGTLESLEQELLPLAIGNPQRKVYRRLLVEIYGNLTFALVQREPARQRQGRRGGARRARAHRRARRQAAARRARRRRRRAAARRDRRARLRAEQERGLGALRVRDRTGARRRCARARCSRAAPCATSRSCRSTRAPLPEAGRRRRGDGLGHDRGAPRRGRVAKLGDKKAIPLLRKVAQSGTPDMRAFAVLGLGSLKDKTSTALLSATARSLDAGTVARAAAAYALGELGADTETTTLVTLAEGTDALPREMAILALARMGMTKGESAGGKAALAAMADAVFSGRGRERARASVVGDACARPRPARSSCWPRRARPTSRPDALPAPDESVDAESTLDQLVPRALSAKDRAAALVVFAEPLKRAAQSALSTSTERARAVLDALGAARRRVRAVPRHRGRARARRRARQGARDRARRSSRASSALSRHPGSDACGRRRSCCSRARSRTPRPPRSPSAVTDSSESVQRVALASIGQHADAKSVTAAAKVMRGHESWAMRVLAAQALGRLGAAGAGAEATRQLKEAATKESYALVREAALVALSTYDKTRGVPARPGHGEADPEPRVRETATKIRSGK